jgi:hypothetical protein
MREVVGEFTGKKIGPTFFQGSKSIDGIWATSNLIITHACVMPARDHCMFVIDFQESSTVCSASFQVQHYSSWHLNTNVLSGATQNTTIDWKRIFPGTACLKKLGILHHCHVKRKTFQRKLNKLDKQSRDLILNAEKKCHHI